jgi:hypothetical protein
MPVRLAAALVLASLAALLPPPAVAQEGERCQAVEVAGTATLRRGGTEVEASRGAMLARGDRIATGPAGRVVILCTGGLRISVGPDAVILLDRVIGRPAARPGLRLLEGAAGFLLPAPRRDGFSVRTPSAVAAVRSTEWAMQVEAGATAAFVHEGGVAIGTAARTVLLESGEGVDVSSQGFPGPVRDWGAARVEALARRIGADW